MQAMFQQLSFFKNLSIAGGLLVLAAAGAIQFALASRSSGGAGT